MLWWKLRGYPTLAIYSTILDNPSTGRGRSLPIKRILFSAIFLIAVLWTPTGFGTVQRSHGEHLQSYNSNSKQPLLMTASWYGKKFNGKRTASGERYDPSLLTAAHQTLPFGTRIKLTFSQTGKSVVVRINDRGPWCKNRDLDISEAAATCLGMKKAGVAQVLVEVLH